MPAIEVSITLRALVREDAPLLASASRALGGHETIEDWVRLIERADGVAIGADASGVLVGYAAGGVRGGFGQSEAAGWLEAFGVAVAWRGRGVGRELAAALLAQLRARGARKVFTLVPSDDVTLLPFLREIGFREQPLACLGRRL